MKKRAIKTVKNSKALKEFALTEGAEITDKSGKTFNAGGEKIDKKPFFLIKEKEQPKPELEKPSIDAKLIASATEKAAEDNRKIMTDIKNQLASLKFEMPPAPDEWVFDIIRNKDGFIKQIRTKAVYHQGIKH